MPFLLSDTVGFIRKLPHNLIESFQSTLAEAGESDILLHVVDASHPRFEEHIQVVKETLREIGITNKQVITVFNKFDLLDEDARSYIQQSYFSNENTPAVFVSAREKWNLDALRKLLALAVRDHYRARPQNGYYFLQDDYLIPEINGYEQVEDEVVELED